MVRYTHLVVTSYGLKDSVAFSYGAGFTVRKRSTADSANEPGEHGAGKSNNSDRTDKCESKCERSVAGSTDTADPLEQKITSAMIT